MRLGLVAIVMCGGCSLYFGNKPTDDSPAPPGDDVRPPDGGEAPLLWFPFDEPSNAVGLTNLGTWNGAIADVHGTQGVPGIHGNALELASLTDGVTIHDPSDGSLDSFTAWTLEGWINLDELPHDGYMTLAKKNLAYMCRLVESYSCDDCYTGQNVGFIPDLRGANWSMPAPALHTWQHLACTYDGDTLRVFWNGAQRAATPGGHQVADSSQDFAIGKDATGGENLVGRIDDFKLWTQVRSAAQICSDACGSYDGSTCVFDGDCAN